VVKEANKMRDFKIQIVGCGYIGRKIAQILSAKALSACCFVMSEKSRQSCELLGLQVQRLDLDNVQRASGFEESVIVYLVPPSGGNKVAKNKMDMRMGHFVAMLEACPVAPKKILLISTTGVYGDCEGRWIDETQPANPQADRAHRRLSAESQLKAYCERAQVACVIFRVPGIYCADKLPLRRITSGEPIVRAEDSGYTNRIHADDLAAFCVEVLTAECEQGVYNCCDGQPSTMYDYFTRVATAMNLPAPEEISLQQAQQQLSAGMLSYLAESKRISNKKLLRHFKTRLQYPDLQAGLENCVQSSL